MHSGRSIKTLCTDQGTSSLLVGISHWSNLTWIEGKWTRHGAIVLGHFFIFSLEKTYHESTFFQILVEKSQPRRYFISVVIDVRLFHHEQSMTGTGPFLRVEASEIQRPR